MDRGNVQQPKGKDHEVDAKNNCGVEQTEQAKEP